MVILAFAMMAVIRHRAQNNQRYAAWPIPLFR
jgi:hypothetical protein